MTVRRHCGTIAALIGLGPVASTCLGQGSSDLARSAGGRSACHLTLDCFCSVTESADGVGINCRRPEAPFVTQVSFPESDLHKKS